MGCFFSKDYTIFSIRCLTCTTLWSIFFLINTVFSIILALCYNWSVLPLTRCIITLGSSYFWLESVSNLFKRLQVLLWILNFLFNFFLPLLLFFLLMAKVHWCNSLPFRWLLLWHQDWLLKLSRCICWCVSILAGVGAVACDLLRKMWEKFINSILLFI